MSLHMKHLMLILLATSYAARLKPNMQAGIRRNSNANSSDLRRIGKHANSSDLQTIGNPPTNMDLLKYGGDLLKIGYTVYKELNSEPHELVAGYRNIEDLTTIEVHSTEIVVNYASMFGVKCADYHSWECLLDFFFRDSNNNPHKGGGATTHRGVSIYDIVKNYGVYPYQIVCLMITPKGFFGQAGHVGMNIMGGQLTYLGHVFLFGLDEDAVELLKLMLNTRKKLSWQEVMDLLRGKGFNAVYSGAYRGSRVDSGMTVAIDHIMVKDQIHETITIPQGKCMVPTCGSNGFCVGYETTGKVFCYGDKNGCLWGSNDCRTDKDCEKYDFKSDKYTDGDYPECPGDGWRKDACTCDKHMQPKCGVNKFCVGFEPDLKVYCYGSTDGCLWGSNDCDTNEDCAKYDPSSPKYTDGDSPTCPAADGNRPICTHNHCPANEWRADACRTSNRRFSGGQIVTQADWQCHNYEEGQGNSWCMSVGTQDGVEYQYNGGQSPMNCGHCWCCKRHVEQAWVKISETHACETNSEGIVRTSGAEGYSIESCKRQCTGSCMAIDFYANSGWCNFYDTACTTPQAQWDGSTSWKRQAPTTNLALKYFEEMGEGHCLDNDNNRPPHCHKQGYESNQVNDCKALCDADVSCAGYEFGQEDYCQLIYPTGVSTCPDGFNINADARGLSITRTGFDTGGRCYKKASKAVKVVEVGHHCANFVNLWDFGTWTGGSLQQCLQVVGEVGNAHGCDTAKGFFQYNEKWDPPDCGCAKDGCLAKTIDANWNIYQIV